ncbi:hypothetical protein [Streptomyces sp. ALI-76-A]|jgi:hypothetical protein|uniref:hypothetical protein n=1 Tax=Streptomyces sp. ALI-76-A TaxID=3025736 RepID=UPI00256ED27D|nr:hypothetical protein [Streptomyces sp. ALI-76-A]MDL5198851.1 hypothetical protein [Streptomyces sp. ALI-76-A]
MLLALQQRWADAALAVAFDDLDPVSAPGGAGTAVGAGPVVVGHHWAPRAAGSNAMRTQLMALDRDPRVSGMADGQYGCCGATTGGQVRSWMAQLFARNADGTALLADCPGRPDTGGERALQAAQAVAAACADIGWSHRRLAQLDEVPTANLKRLAGYRHLATRADPA